MGKTLLNIVFTTSVAVIALGTYGAIIVSREEAKRLPAGQCCVTLVDNPGGPKKCKLRNEFGERTSCGWTCYYLSLANPPEDPAFEAECELCCMESGLSGHALNVCALACLSGTHTSCLCTIEELPL